MVEKYYNDKGQLGVLISPGYGAGWATWNCIELAYDKRIVEAFLAHATMEEMEKVLEENGYNDVYMGGFYDLEIQWIDKGTTFQICEYDGSEYINILSVDNCITA